MKRFLSILLVAVMLLGMLPATSLTAFAEDTVVATFELGANGSASHSDTTSAKTSYTETDGDYTLTLTGANMYPNSRDAKGNGCIKLGASSKAGSFSLTAPNDVSSVVIYIAKYKANTTKITVNGTAYTLTNASNNGAYDTITVDTTTNKTVSLTTVSGGYRAMVNTITYVVSAAEGACEHTNKTEQTDGYAATCTEEGKTNSWVCDDCDEIADAQKTIPAINHANKTLQNEAVAGTCQVEGTAETYYCPDCKSTLGGESTGLGNHNYVDGTCSVCGAAQPAEEEVTISFATADQRVSLDTNSQVWANGDVTFTNNKGSGSNVADYIAPARFYKSSVLVFEAPGNITTIVVDCNSSSYATELQNSVGAEATVSGDKVTIVPATAADSYTVASLTAQVRVDSVTVTYKTGASTEPEEPECEHTNKVAIGEAKGATCTEPGTTAGEKCADCGEIITAQEEIPATGHSFVNGECTVCYATDPFANLGGRYYIAAYRNSESKYYYMSSTLVGTSTKRYEAVATNILPSNIAPDAAESSYVFILTSNGDGTICIQAEGVDGNNYLGWTSGNSGALVEDAFALTLNESTKVEGAYNIHFTGDEERYLSLNEAKDSNYFAWYKGTMIQDLILIPVAEAETTSATLCGDVDGISVSGKLELDLNGFAATNVTATQILAYDSTATVTTAGTGSLTTTSEVVIDNTANGVRYIALNTEGAYSFHVLDMKLSAVTLRTSQAGIYYKATVSCDPTLAAAAGQHGIVLSTRNMPGANFATEQAENGDVNGWTVNTTALVSGEEFTSGSVFGIFKEGLNNNTARGEVKIYANAYIIVDGTVIMADTTVGDKALNEDGTENTDFNGIAWSLRGVMEAVDDKYSTLGDQQAMVLEFYNTWKDAMSGWALPNIAAASAA